MDYRGLVDSITPRKGVYVATFKVTFSFICIFILIFIYLFASKLPAPKNAVKSVAVESVESTGKEVEDEEVLDRTISSNVDQVRTWIDCVLHI